NLRVGRNRNTGYEREEAGQVAAPDLDVVDLTRRDQIAALGAGRLNSAALRRHRYCLTGVADLEADVANGASLGRGQHQILSPGEFEARRFHADVVSAGRDAAEYEVAVVVGGSGSSHAGGGVGDSNLGAYNRESAWIANCAHNRSGDRLGKNDLSFEQQKQ